VYKRQVIYNAIAYGFVFLLNILHPICFGTSVYGYFVLQLSIYSFLVPIFTFGLDSAYFRYYFDSSFLSRKELASAIYYVWFCAGLILLGGFLVIIEISNLHMVLKVDKIDLFLISISSFLSAPIEIVRKALIAKERPFHFGVNLILSKVLLFLSLFLTPLLLGLSQDSFSIMFVIFSGTYLLIAFISERWDLHYPSFKKLKEIIVYSAPLGFNSLFSIGFSHGYKVYVSPLLTFSQLGTLNIITQFSMVFTIISNSMSSSYNAKFYKKLSQVSHSISEEVVSYFKFITFISVLLFTFIFAGGMFFFSYYNKGEYGEGLFLLPILLFGIFVYSFKSVGNSILAFYKHTNSIVIITIGLSLINLLLLSLIHI
jgi:O-antigen/teichoic acid export membrane protein